MIKKTQPKTINLFLNLIADSITFWGVFSFCVFLYNTGFLGLSRSVFDVTQTEIFLSYLLFIYVLYNNGAYIKKRDFAGIKRLKGVIKGTLQVVLIYIVLAYTIKYQIPRIISMTFIITIPIAIIFSRLLIQLIEAKLFRNINQENIIVFGAGKVGNAFVAAVSKLSSSPLKIIGFIDDRKNINTTTTNNKPILGGLKNLESIIIKHKIDHIIVAIKEPNPKTNLILKKITEKHEISLSFHPTKKLFEKNPYKLEDIAGLPLLSSTQYSISEKPFYNLFKRIFDVFVGFICLILTIPIWILASLAIKISDGGPIFFKQTRIGINEKPFIIFKFRSMKPNSKKYEHCPIDGNDPRITKVGNWLRKFSIDEIPQLINVLKGDMSLVGPRPEMPFIVDTYENYEKKRFSVLPGITGLWQVSPARKSEIHDNPEYDLLYIEQRDLSLDLLILILTLVFVFRSFTH
ncbi:MAG: hypothetical protein CMG55_10585 [Candidatus Marinimicrobia bacterium]|nr:hypothetical protein [Candidatus Neomarinimicrobiota bacterium]|tara:strand:- start:692 stop:2074 length:1383 start_codon:yes stop_codon:yes gene_type:complete